MRQRHEDAPKKRSRKVPQSNEKTNRAAKKKTSAKKTTKPSAPCVSAAKKKAAKKKAGKRTSKPRVRVAEPEGLFTEARVDRFLRYIRACYYQHEAAPLCRVSTATVQRWLSRGRARRDARESWLARFDERESNQETTAEIEAELGPCPEHDQWSEFVVEYERGEVLAKRTMMKVVIRDALMNPSTAQWWLEKRHPRDFGRAAERPGIGMNAGDLTESGEGDAIDGLEKALDAFEDRVAATVDPKAGQLEASAS